MLAKSSRYWKSDNLLAIRPVPLRTGMTPEEQFLHILKQLSASSAVMLEIDENTILKTGALSLGMREDEL